MSTIIKLRCIDQVLTFESTPVIASGGLEEDVLSVEFCSKWDGMAKTAVFWRSEEDAYHVLLDEHGSCTIPREVLAEEGVFYFGVFGVSSDGRQRTTEAMRYNVVRGAITAGTKPPDPTPDLYTQLLTDIAGALVEIEQVVEATESAAAAAEASRKAAEASAKSASQLANHSHTAADVGAAAAADHQVETYTALSSLGLTADSMSPTDAEANFLAIFKALQSRSELWLYTSPTTIANLQASITAKLSADLGLASPPTLLDCRFERVGAYTMFIRVTAQNYNATHLWHLKEFDCVLRYSEGNYQDLSPFILSRDPGGFYGPAHKPSAADVGARPADWFPTAAEVGARPDDWVPTAADVGTLPVIDAPTIGGDENDMDKVLTKGPHLALYRTNSTTANTPGAKGITSMKNAMILSFGVTETRGVQIAFISGSNLMCLRRLYGSTPDAWGSFYSENNMPAAEDLGAVSKSGDTMLANALLRFITSTGAGGGLQAFTTGMTMAAYNDATDTSSNRRGLRLAHPSKSDTAAALQMSETVNGKTSWFPVLHTGNIAENGVAKIEYGTYTGTGIGGANNPTSVTLSFEPKVLIVTPIRRQEVIPEETVLRFLVWSKGLTESVGANGDHSRLYTQNGNTVSWYISDTNAAGDDYQVEQLNKGGSVYHYIAIG